MKRRSARSGAATAPGPAEWSSCRARYVVAITQATSATDVPRVEGGGLGILKEASRTTARPARTSVRAVPGLTTAR
jgi:hypothetical protein